LPNDAFGDCASKNTADFWLPAMCEDSQAKLPVDATQTSLGKQLSHTFQTRK
jgi:hypothetical protein